MEIDNIKKDLFKTFDVIDVKECPALIEEVVHYFINSNKTTQISNAEVTNRLEGLEKDGLIFINEEGFVSFTPSMTIAVQKRLHLDAHTKDQEKFARNILKSLSRFGFIKLISAAGESPLGRIGRDEKIKLILVSEKDTKYLAKFVVNTYLKFRGVSKRFEVENVMEMDDLTWDSSDAKNGVRLLNLLVFTNKDKTYEMLMAANNWVFEIFENYPLEKVSWGFRISSKAYTKVPAIYRQLNSFLGPKK